MKKTRMLVVFWHSVESDAMPAAARDSVNPSASVFREQLRFLVRNYTPVSCWEFLKLLDGERRIRSYPKPPVLLSFDDGFRNVIRNALPVLSEFNVPAVFFVLGELLRNPGFVPWFVEVKHILRKARWKSAVYRGISLDFTHGVQGMTARNFIFSAVAACRSTEERERVLEDLATSVGACRPLATDLDEDLRFISKDDLAQIADSRLIAVASHGMTHRHLDSLDAEEQLYELRESDSVLREHSTAYCPVVAYPSGAFNAATVSLASRVYKAGFGIFLGSSFRSRHAYPRVGLDYCTARDLEYCVSPFRLNWLLPLKRALHVSGLRRAR